jgi:hypothetical protein
VRGGTAEPSGGFENRSLGWFSPRKPLSPVKPGGRPGFQVDGPLDRCCRSFKKDDSSAASPMLAAPAPGLQIDHGIEAISKNLCQYSLFRSTR